MNRPAVFEIAAQPDAQMIEPSFFLAERHHIGERLSGMEMSPVPRVDDGYAGIQRGGQGGPGHRMPHSDDVRVAADHPDGIFQGFPFGNRGVRRIVEPDDPPAQPQHGGLKGHLGAGGGLIKQRGQDLPPAHAVIIVQMRADIAGETGDVLPFLRG